MLDIYHYFVELQLPSDNLINLFIYSTEIVHNFLAAPELAKS